MASKAAKRQKLAELQALRAAGKKTFDTYEVEQNDFYEEVDEEDYKKLVRERLNRDDFVVDDNGEGYADDGREEWDRPEQQQYSDSDEDVKSVAKKGSKKGKGKGGREAEQAKKDAANRHISDFFTKGQTKIDHKPRMAKTKDDDDFLSGILDEVGANVPAVSARLAIKRPRSPERYRTRVLSPARESRQPSKKVRLSVEHSPAPKPATLPQPLPQPVSERDEYYEDDDDDDNIAASDLHLLPSDDPAPSSPTAKVAQRKDKLFTQHAAVGKKQTKPHGNSKDSGGSGVGNEGDDDTDDDLLQVTCGTTIKMASVNVSGSRLPPQRKVQQKVLDREPTSIPITSSPARPADPEHDASAWNDITSKLNVINSQASEPASLGKVDSADVVNDDGSLDFFWVDYTEANGTLLLFGKVRNKKTKAYVSCFVQVTNILRKLYFLPRKHKYIDGQEGDEEVGMLDVFNEVDAVMGKMNITEHKAKKCTRKYAFELPGVPRESEYLKLFYSYKKPILTQTSGATFSHVFGTNTALFEQFVLWKNIMGPCWLKIKDGDFDALKNASHCKLEVLVDHPGKMISVLDESDGLEAPPFTLMSLAMRTTFNVQTNKREILALSARIYEHVSISDTTPAEKLPCRTFTLVRSPESAFPIGFETLVRNRKRGLIKTCRVERELLSFFLTQISNVDPDVVLGHGLEGVDYSVLLHRIQEHKLPQWSVFGRLRRSSWPGAMSKTGGNVFAERQVISGRLLCDLANDAGKSLMTKCSSWSLTEMCSLYLSAPHNQRRDIDSDAAIKSWAATKEGLLDYLTHLETDTFFIAALALRTQILPLTKVLTNLAGNSWTRTLMGTRAERNEYILLHEFHRNKYVVPDKQTFRGRRAAEIDEPRDDEAGAPPEGKKKDKYKGGLVFDPEKGLYDKYVLVMDFNSLYPSIIQEFNICFTTVERGVSTRTAATTEADPHQDEDEVPEVPVQQEQGILPRLLATLVQRRRQVKSLMKDKNATPEQLATWDIRQLALKLTANSMYGCLGFTKSRFYARPLAVLITFKGREILRSTKELAESKSLQVIYGDTDSVMINANVDNVADAQRVGREFRDCVNERYKLLEIDIDNIFRRILLQAKKKYAAISLIEKDGKWVESMEVKGLDLKRREYCALSKEVSTRVLNEILSGDDAEAVVTRIHEYLRETAAAMRAGSKQIPPAKYIIYTQLGKNPQEYPDKDSKPQVQVALRQIAKGKVVRKGDVISYIITLGDRSTPDSGSAPAPLRAYAPKDVLQAPLVKSEDGQEVASLAPDVEWYISKQIFPPVERLCANIAGTSALQIAENLGIDIKRSGLASSSYATFGGQDGGEAEIHPLETQIPDSIRFQSCTPLQLRCRACKTSASFKGLVLSSASHMSKDGIRCPQPRCAALIPTYSVVLQTEAQLRRFAAKYYEGVLVCDDPACSVRRTRLISVYGSRCLGPMGLGRGCTGRMRWAVSERDAYNQIVYFAGLFDVDKARETVLGGAGAGAAVEGGGVVTNAAGEVEVEDFLDDGGGDNSKDADGSGSNLKRQKLKVSREIVLALAEQNRLRFGTVKGVVDQYLAKCGRRWVHMDVLFAKLGFST